MEQERIYIQASDVSMETPESNDQFLVVRMRMFSTRANRNKQGVTEAFIDEIVENPEKYYCTPLYVDEKRLKKHQYYNLGHLYNEKTGRFATTQVGGFCAFEKQEDDYGISLYGEARIPKREIEICNAVAEMFDLGILNFSFEISYTKDGVIEDEENEVIYVDAADGNALTGMAIVSVPAYPESVALSLVAEELDPEDHDDESPEESEPDDPDDDKDEDPEEAEHEGDENKMEEKAMDIVAESTEEVVETTAIAETEETAIAETETPAAEETEVVIAEEQPVVEAEAEADVAIASLTFADIHNKLQRAWDADHKWAYMSFIFPEEHIAWFHSCEADDTEFVQIGYEVNGNEVNIVSEETIRIELGIRDLNRFYAEAKAEEAKKEHEQKVAKISAFAQKQDLDIADEAVAKAIAELNYEAIADLAEAKATAIAETVEPEIKKEIVLVASYTDMKIDELYGGLI